MSEACVTTVFDCEASRKTMTAAYNRIKVTSMAIISSVSVKPANFL
jgi:hypothetical protein